jgi:hypothetical protein
VIGTKDADVNLGRESRLFRPQHWLALLAAGVTGCSIGSCSIPLAYTELHHLTWWHEHGGRTDLANCLPYCSYHHHEIHRLGIRISRRRDGAVEHRHPDGRIYGDAPPLEAGGSPEAGAAEAQPCPADPGAAGLAESRSGDPNRVSATAAGPKPPDPNVACPDPADPHVANSNAAPGHGRASPALPAKSDPAPTQGALFAA